jgi:hypothetical protein
LGEETVNIKVTAVAAAAAAVLGGGLAAVALPAGAAPQPPTLTTVTVTATASPFVGVAQPVTATCPAGTTLTGGGFDAGTAPGTAVGVSRPDGSNGWTAQLTGGPAGDVMTVYAVCGSISGK